MAFGAPHRFFTKMRLEAQLHLDYVIPSPQSLVSLLVLAKKYEETGQIGLKILGMCKTILIHLSELVRKLLIQKGKNLIIN